MGYHYNLYVPLNTNCYFFSSVYNNTQLTFNIHIYSYIYCDNLLRYPSFENLFSLVRKLNFKKSPLVADKNHLHQLIFFYIKKKYSLTTLISNNITSCIINFINLIIFLLGSITPSHSQSLIIYIIIAIILYTISYIKLVNLKIKKTI